MPSRSATWLLAVLIFGGYEYFLSSRHNSDDYANLNGTLLTSQGKYNEAIAQFDRSIKVAPDWCQPDMGRGNSHQLKGEYDQALPDLDTSIALKPDYAESHYDRGLVWRDKSDDSHALADFGEAIRLDPTGVVGARASYERARIFHRQKAFDSALANLNHALAQQEQPT